jgi:peroxiredoxin
MPDGKYASRWTFIIGTDGKVLEVMQQVSPKTHGRDVAARLAELGVKRRDAAPAASGSAAP